MNWHQFRHGSITYIHPQFTCTYLCLAGWPRYIFGKRGSLYFLQFTLFKVHTCTYVHALVYLHGFVKFQNFPQQTVIKSAMQMITFMSMIINVVCTCMCIIRWGGGKYAILKTPKKNHRISSSLALRNQISKVHLFQNSVIRSMCYQNFDRRVKYFLIVIS